MLGMHRRWCHLESRRGGGKAGLERPGLWHGHAISPSSGRRSVPPQRAPRASVGRGTDGPKVARRVRSRPCTADRRAGRRARPRRNGPPAPRSAWSSSARRLLASPRFARPAPCGSSASSRPTVRRAAPRWRRAEAGRRSVQTRAWPRQRSRRRSICGATRALVAIHRRAARS